VNLDRIERCTFPRYSPAVSRVAWHVLGDASLAQDVVQETFLQVWKYADRYRGEGSLKSWILAIATNLCRRTLLRGARLPQVVQRETTDAEARDERGDAEREGCRSCGARFYVSAASMSPIPRNTAAPSQPARRAMKTISRPGRSGAPRTSSTR
jgi:RNA polymerase sigma factor (sigma-70 family)